VNASLCHDPGAICENYTTSIPQNRHFAKLAVVRFAPGPALEYNGSSLIDDPGILSMAATHAYRSRRIARSCGLGLDLANPAGSAIQPKRTACCRPLADPIENC
jgi:hypothetical protein